MSLIGDRQLPSQLLVGLEGSGCGRLGSGGPSGRLSDPLRPSTSSIRATTLPAGVLPTVHQGSRLNPGASKPSSEGGSRTSPTVSWFLQPSVPRPEGVGVVASHHRPVYPERLRHLISLPHGDSTVSPSFHPSGRLDDILGPAGRLPAGSCSSRFVVQGRAYQFRVLCFGLTTAPQVFTRIMAPVSTILHKYGIRMLRYLDDWLILASSELACLQSRDRLLTVCTELGIQVNLTKSSLVPTQSLVYLGMEIRSLPFIARPTPARVSNLLRLIEEFLSTLSPPAFLWRRLLGHLTLVVPHAPCPRRDAPDEVDPDLPQGPVGFSRRPVSGLLVPFLSGGSSLVGSSGATAGGSESLSSYSRHQLFLRRLGRRLGGPSRRTPCLGPLVSSSGRSLHQLERAVGSSVRPTGLRTSISGPVGGAVLRQYHHSRLSSSFRRDVLLHSERHGERNPSMGRDQPCPSPASIHHGLVQCHSRHSESPQSGDRVRVDSPSGGGRSPGPQMAGGDRSFCDVTDRQASGVFLTGLRFEGGGDGRSPSLCLSSDRHHKESSCQTEVFEELRVDSHRSVLASEGLVPGPSGTVVQYSHGAAKSKRSSKTAPLPWLSSKSAYASADCMATIKRFSRQAGFSSTVA